MSFFDTSFIIDLLRERRRGQEGPAHRKLEVLGDTPVRLSVFVVCELEAGAALSRDPREIRRVRLFCEQCEIVYPDERFAPRYGTVLAALKRQRYTVATMDVLIATLALLDRDKLITRNLKDFQKIPDLHVEGY